MSKRLWRAFGAGRQFRGWLLAGASLAGLSGPAGAEPIQPFWLIPTALADSGLHTITLPKQSITLWRAEAHTPHDLRLFLGPDSETALWNLTPWPRLNLSGVSEAAGEGFTSPFSFKVQSAPVELQPSVNAKIARFAKGLNFKSGSIAAQSAGFEASLLDGRFKLSSDFIETDDQSDDRDFRDPQLRSQPREIRTQDISRRHSFTAKLIDSENLRLMVDGEFGQVSDSFATAYRELPSGHLVLPGSWAHVNSRLEYGRANLSVGFQDFESRNEGQKREHVVLGFASSELKLYRKQGSEFNLINGGQWLKRTSFSGINADIIVADVLPTVIAEAIDPIRPFLPTSVNGGFERGDVMRSEFTTGPRDKVSTANLSMAWDTSRGQTTASFWERRISTDMITPGVEDGVALSRSRDRYVDISHSVRRGNWKFGAGLSLIETNDEVMGVKNSGSEYAPHVSVGYEPEHGAKIELRFGAADAQSQIVDDNLAARAKTKQVQLSVDVSDYVREELDRPDAKLKLEYRYDFSGGERETTNGRERDGGHAVLVTFSTPLN